MSPPPMNVVDLTLEDNHGLYSNNLVSGPNHFGSNHFAPSPRDAPSLNASHHQNQPHGNRPFKRQRTTGSDSSEATRQERSWAQLKRCLDAQVFPHIESALAQLEPYSYSNDERKKLDEDVFEKIVKRDKDFERNFKYNRGHLSQDFEDYVRTTAVRLVQQDIERRSALPILHVVNGSAATAAVLPSIEQEEGQLATNDRSFDASAKAGASEHYDNYDDHKELGQVSSDEYHNPRPTKSKKKPITLRRARIQAKQWQSGKEVDTSRKPVPKRRNNAWFGTRERPYLQLADREGLLNLQGRLVPGLGLPEDPLVVHVDFTQTEIEHVQKVARSLLGSTVSSRDTLRDLRHLLKKANRLNVLHQLYEAHEASRIPMPETERHPDVLTSRSSDDLRNFVADLYFRRLNAAPQVLSVNRDDTDAYGDTHRTSLVPSLLYTREIFGRRPFSFGSIRRFESFRAAFTANREDYFEPRIEWTNCAGDIMTLSWTAPNQFICGTTTHSDSHNQQYNKPGNLLLGSSEGTLRAFADHRIPRPVVSTGDNSLDSMVESQDPWLYTSVVSSDYDRHNDLAFTSSFDKTVKVWKVQDGAMKAVDTWEHGGRVNFVLASKHRGEIPSADAISIVATGADVATDAVRVYKLYMDPAGSVHHTFNSYSCTKVHDEDYVPSDKWAYFPAAIRWGLAPKVQHLLLIGYSPRSLTDLEEDIPEDKKNGGELCLWDTLEKRQISVNSAATQNVFEVAWHPSQNSFAAATSKGIGIERAESVTKTQIRIFQENSEGQYTSIKVLDCRAMDINELVIRQNSPAYTYVAAGCTDGNVYVWDTAGTDRPICVLSHGEPVEEHFGDREREDVGVKFVEWASSTDRLYTGSSDGLVKVWDIRQGRAVLVRDLIECAGPVTFGAFSPDQTQLAVGDGSGRVYLLSLDEGEREEVKPIATATTGLWNVQLDGQQKKFRRPRPFIPHAEVPPPAPAHTDAVIGSEYLQHQVLQLHPDPTIGAVQGPNYAACGYYRAEAHVDGDPNQPLLEDIERKQQYSAKNSSSENPQQGTIARVKGIMNNYSSFAATRENHWRNRILDLDIAGLEEGVKAELDVTEPDFDLMYEEDDFYGEEMYDESVGPTGHYPQSE